MGKHPPRFASSRQDDFRGSILAATGWRRIKRSRRMLSHVSTLMLHPYDKLVANLKHGGAFLLPQGGYPPRPPARQTTPASPHPTTGNDARLIRHKDEGVSSACPSWEG
jgi:hypothetical protein